MMLSFASSNALCLAREVDPRAWWGTYLGDSVALYANLALSGYHFSAFPLWFARVVGTFSKSQFEKNECRESAWHFQ